MCTPRASASTSSGCAYSRSIRSRTRRSSARSRRRCCRRRVCWSPRDRATSHRQSGAGRRRRHQTQRPRRARHPWLSTLQAVEPLQPDDPAQVGRYRLLGRLGRGRHGPGVPGGWRPGGRPVAVKVIRAELAEDPGFRARFGREVAAAARGQRACSPRRWSTPTRTAGCPGWPPRTWPGRRCARRSRARAAAAAPACWRWPPGWPRRWPPSTPPGSCTATSSPPTCCWPRTARG